MNQEPTRECCELCLDGYPQSEEMSKGCGHSCHSIKPPVEGDFRWKDTKKKVEDKVLIKDHLDWLEKNNDNMEMWTGKEWIDMASTPDSNDWVTELYKEKWYQQIDHRETEIIAFIKSQKDKSRADTLSALKEKIEKLRRTDGLKLSEYPYIYNQALDDILKEI